MIYDYYSKSKVCNKFEKIVRVAMDSDEVDSIMSYMPDSSRLHNGINDSGVII